MRSHTQEMCNQQLIDGSCTAIAMGLQMSSPCTLTEEWPACSLPDVDQCHWHTQVMPVAPAC